MAALGGRGGGGGGRYIKSLGTVSTDEWTFMKFSGYVGYCIRDSHEHFEGVALNPLDTGIFVIIIIIFWICILGE